MSFSRIRQCTNSTDKHVYDYRRGNDIVSSMKAQKTNIYDFILSMLLGI